MGLTTARQTKIIQKSQTPVPDELDTNEKV